MTQPVPQPAGQRLIFLPRPHLSPDDLLVQVVPEHLELRHGLLDGAAIGLLAHLLQQEARLVVEPLHLDLQLVGLLFELLSHRHKQQRESRTDLESKLWIIVERNAIVQRRNWPAQEGGGRCDKSWCNITGLTKR